MLHSKNHQGFSLIELLVVLAIIAVLGTIGIQTFYQSSNNLSLDNDAQLVIENLIKAHQQAVGSKNRTPWGIHFTQNNLILFSSSVFNPTDPNNKTFDLSSQSIISNISLSNGSDVIFNQLDGSATSYGTLIISLKKNSAQNKLITVLQSGLIYLTSLPIQNNTRIQDTRHIDLSLGLSIQNKTTLSFIFSQSGYADQRFDIPMSAYFNADKSSFDWSSTTLMAFSSPQTLRIHTHFLDATSTVLCAHRYQDQNNKAVQILIDNQNIISYSETGQATKGATVQSMTIQ